jgi:hypothetical protein
MKPDVKRETSDGKGQNTASNPLLIKNEELKIIN